MLLLLLPLRKHAIFLEEAKERLFLSLKKYFLYKKNITKQNHFYPCQTCFVLLIV